MTNNMQKRKLKLNKNKKGFSLVELLVAVALIAIMTPVLVEGFTFAAKLNYRSRLQQHVDNAATDIYEGIASVEYDELKNYLSSINGWSPVDDGTGSEYAYYVTKPYEDIQNCNVTVSVQKYSEHYIVPDLNFIGVKSAYLTLASEINDFDSVIESRIIQGIKSDNDVKIAIKNDIAEKLKKHGVTVADVDDSRVLIDCGTIDISRISKQTTVIADVVGDQFVADYKVSYRYPANIANPSEDSADLIIGYSYSHRIDGKWQSVSNNALKVREKLKTLGVDNFQFVMEGVDDYASVDAVKSGDFYKAQTMFIYYNPLNNKDWIDIKSNNASTDIHHKVFFIEQGVEGDTDFTLSLDSTRVSSSLNNFNFSNASRTTNDYTQLLQNGKIIDLYSNNPTIAPKGIPDTIYESTEKEATMYRISVEVVCDSNMFANVSGTFKAGGDSVGKYSK